ncbi:hypothetical protein BH24ACT12_BH24ACT12_19380 [soil metagenome]
MRRLSQSYGAHPAHLVSLLASFVVAGYAAFRLLPQGALGVAVWFVGAAIVHDLVLLPAYAAVDRLVHGPRVERPEGPPKRLWANYVRVPLALSGLLLLVYFPAILRLSSGFEPTTTLSSDGYLWRWLAITAVLFALGGLAYVIRQRPGRSRGAIVPT